VDQYALTQLDLLKIFLVGPVGAFRPCARVGVVEEHLRHTAARALLQVGDSQVLVHPCLIHVRICLVAPPIGGVSFMPARTSAMCRTSIAEPSRLSLRAMPSRQPSSLDTSMPAPASRMSSVSAAEEDEQALAPKPQHFAAPGSSRSATPSTAESSARGCSRMPSSPSAVQLSCSAMLASTRAGPGSACITSARKAVSS